MINNQKPKIKDYLKLFYYMFTISMFTFGGGFVIVPMYKKQFCEKLKWIDDDTMTDLIIIAQTTPGSIAVNASILVGQKVFGIKGGLFAMIATVLPPLIIISLISVFYNAFKENLLIQNLLLGMRGVISAIILDVALTMALQLKKNKDIIGIVMFFLALIISVLGVVNVIYIILVSGVIGLVRTLIELKLAKKGGKA